MNAESVETLRHKIRSIDSVPSMPVIIRPLLEMLQRPLEKLNVADVVNLISCDKSLAVQCVRMANSPLFPRLNEVENVRSAVVALGLQRVQSIVLGCSLNQIVPADKWVLEMSIFWRHSLGCALVSRKIATLIGYADPEKAYLAGLIHDVGILVNSMVCHEKFRRCLQLASSEKITLVEAEEKCLGFSHVLTGKILAEQWNLPQNLSRVIEYHHAVSDTETEALVCLVRLSDLICRVRDLGYGYYENIAVDLVNEPAWTALEAAYSGLKDMDGARLLLDVEASMDAIIKAVDDVFVTKN